MDKTLVSNLIRLEYSEIERDDIHVEMYREDRNNYTYYFLSRHKRDIYCKRVKYWKWHDWDKKLSESS